jgi:hypothetical protein
MPHNPENPIIVTTFERRELVSKQLVEWALSVPDFSPGNLNDPTKVLSSEKLRARDVALNSLAESRARDYGDMIAHTCPVE